MRKKARARVVVRGSRGVSNCGISSRGRTIGPATRWGKNER